MKTAMKFFKVFVPVLVFISIFAVAMPVAADPPGLNEDPFGGMAIFEKVRIPLCAEPKDCGEIFVDSTTIMQGGVPSKKSGDGTTPRRAIYIGGIWGGPSMDPASGENPPELPNCATVKIPEGSARWFKLDTWGDRRVRIWLDDELDRTTKPSGSAVFGSAKAYMLGAAPGSERQRNAIDWGEGPNFLEGFVMEIFGPDNLKPNYAFNPPNATILTLDTNSYGILKDGANDLSLADIAGAGSSGYGSYNPNIPNHLLWYEGRFDGWVYVFVYNQMIWDGFASVCSQRTR